MATPIIPKFKRGVDSALNKASIEDGTFRIATDTGRLLLDLDGSRIEISDFIKKTDSEIKAILAPLMKFYYATDTHKIYVYDDGWKVIGDTATSASSASKLSTARKISLTGGVTGNVTFDGSEDVSINTTVGDDSHSHTSKTLPEATASSKGVVLLGATGGAATFNHSHSNMKAATASADGGAGMVPAPSAGDQNKLLSGSGTWVDAYSHPVSGVTAGTYRSVTVDENGHVTGGTNPTTLAAYGITDAAAKDHTHEISGVTGLQDKLIELENQTFDASKIVSGTIDLARIPKAAIADIVYVKDEDELYTLTTEQVQKGDTVKVTDSGHMYYVKDDTNLTSADGYEPYTAESASSVPWSGVTDKPTEFNPATHTHKIADVEGLQDALDAASGGRNEVDFGDESEYTVETTGSIIEETDPIDPIS